MSETASSTSSTGTIYVVLRKGETDNGSDAWFVENSRVPALTAESAIRLACKNGDAPQGTYVAIPARSWKPVTVRAEQTVVLKLEEAKT